MKKIPLRVLGISYNKSGMTNYSMLLEEVKGSRKLPVIIGENEAFAISVSLEKKMVKRPIIYDLFNSINNKNIFDVKEVLISEFKKGIFYAQIIIIDQKNKMHFIDCRVSDAVAISLRVDVPIFIYENILDMSKIILTEYGNKLLKIDKQASIENKEENYNQLSIKELKKKLQEAVDTENFELASVIKKIIESKN